MSTKQFVSCWWHFSQLPTLQSRQRRDLDHIITRAFRPHPSLAFQGMKTAACIVAQPHFPQPRHLVCRNIILSLFCLNPPNQESRARVASAHRKSGFFPRGCRLAVSLRIGTNWLISNSNTSSLSRVNIFLRLFRLFVDTYTTRSLISRHPHSLELHLDYQHRCGTAP